MMHGWSKELILGLCLIFIDKHFVHEAKQKIYKSFLHKKELVLHNFFYFRVTTYIHSKTHCT